MIKKLRTFTIDASGATLVEYGVALILCIVMGGTALVALAGQLDTQYGKPTAIYVDPTNN